MPPESPISEHISTEEYSPLTDQNVAILYQIIRSAEQYPNVETQPFRAIFAAYETILPQNGLDPNHDQIYLRFLFRLGDGREEGQSLYARFEGLLDELGLQIEIIPDGEETQEITGHIATDIGDASYDDAEVQDLGEARIRSRRHSVNSVYNEEGESTRRLHSRASMSRLETTEQVVLEPRSASRATTRRTEKTALNFAPSRARPNQAKRGRLTAEEFASNLQHYQRRHRSMSSQRHHQPQGRASPKSNRPGARIPKLTLAESGFSKISHIKDGVFGESAVPQQHRPSYAFAQSKRLYNPSRMQLLRNADTFQNHRIRSIACDLVDKWCYAAVQARDQHERMDRLATARDSETLLRQAFEHWGQRLHIQKQTTARERSFKEIEERIHEARNAQLLGYHFRFWQRWTSYRIARAPQDRHHILRVKYFGTWRKITLVNQLKILSQGQRKFFNIWKQRCIQNFEDHDKALLVRQASLFRTAYWDWFWAFCERRAPEWRDARMKRKYFLKIIECYRSNIRQGLLATSQSRTSIERKTFLPWLAKVRLILVSQREASTFCHQKLFARTLPTWRQDALYSPLARHVSNMVDWRVARVSFEAFVTRYRFEKQAGHIDRLRIVRNQWTKWNDNLRCQALSNRIDERCLYEVLSRWVAVCRANLVRRIFTQRLQRKCLHRLKKKCLRWKQRREARCQTVLTARNMTSLQVIFSHWRSRLASQRQTEQVAFEFYVPKIAQDTLRTWVQYLAYQRNLASSAKEAEFYSLGRKFLKRWHTAAIEAKKQKQRNAYVQIRRGLKLRLAGGIVHLWRRSSQRIREMQQESDTFDQAQLYRVGTDLFDYWKIQLDLRKNQEYQALQHYNKRLIERCLYTWIERLEDQARMEETADVNNEMYVRNIAFGWFHKSRLKIIEQKGREANAENLRIWYERRHFHNMLRQWRTKTAKARSRPPPRTPVLSSRVSRTKRAYENDNGEDLTGRAEEWTEFDMGDWIPALEAQSSSTPLPGYLSTPSKRAARAKALVRVSTTPAGTPFEHRLSSQIGSTPRTRRRTGFGRSVVALRESTFGAILEDAPRTPGV